MKILLLVIILGSSVSLFAQENSNSCYTAGDCSSYDPIYNPQTCFKVKTGKDAQGNATCAPRYVTTLIGYECKKSPGSLLGSCELEKVPSCNLINCDDALDP